MGCSFPTALNIAESYVTLSGKTTSVIIVLATLGEMIVPLLTGNLFDRKGPNVVVWVAFISLCVASLLFLLMMLAGRKTKKSLAAKEKGLEKMNSEVNLISQ